MSSSSLPNHKIHISRQPYRGIECGKCLKKHAITINHHRIHSRKKLHKCNGCAKAFRKNSVPLKVIREFILVRNSANVKTIGKPLLRKQPLLVMRE